MAHISRKELKRDEFRETLTHGAEAVASHQKQVWMIGAVALIVALAIGGWSSYTRRETVKGAAALDDAMKIFQARIRTATDPPPEPGEATYMDEKNKYADAEKKFVSVADQFGRTRPGQEARYYAGLCEARLGAFDRAQKSFDMLGSASDAELAALAKFQLAGVYDKTGKAAQAAQLYQQLADKPSVLVPKPLVLLTLAEHYRKTDPAQAIKLYNQIKKDFADSPAATQADQGLQELNAKS